MRVGLGYDIHRLGEGRQLILGGVNVPHDVGLVGHSDADVLTHAVIDALLGAAAMGDIGQLFPDTDPTWKDADSLDLLARAVQILAQDGWTVGNVDTTVVLQQPKIAEFIPGMRANLARTLGISIGAVSVKATTGERIGFVGREEGVAAQAICTIRRQDD